ncbi:MAG: 4-hydroxy-tetrahydrodipicolinate synthase [Bifidobacteriaceae bacterium]|jgi:4-hydroxy-tetrahydrodipicolinate synthase|nr:4-hydroxy-tetrahydrodipicolinate synthase [Bifidobacteriaceae bacterium]
MPQFEHPQRPFGSLLTAMATPFNDDGTLDLESVHRLATHLVSLGHDGIVVNGTTGEAPTTSDEEKRLIISTVRRAVGPSVKVVAGVGTNNTAHSVTLAEEAAAAGADGLLVVSPYYSRPSQEGLVQHFLRLADATSLPVMVYDIPGRSAVQIDEATLIKLAANPRIVAVKDATGQVGAGFAKMVSTGLAYYAGDDLLGLAFLAGGASGIVSVVGHVTGDLWRQLIDSVDSGQLATARRLQARMLPVIEAVVGHGQGAVMVKAALEALEVLPGRMVRLPLAPATEAQLGHVRQALEAARIRPLHSTRPESA